MAIDWRSSTGGVFGSGFVHFVALLLAPASALIPICADRGGGFRFGEPELVTVPALPPADPIFELAPPASHHVSLALLTGQRCGGGGSVDVFATMVGTGVFTHLRAMRRSPVVCIRIGTDGRVGSARVLRSSGDVANDRAIEAQARRLIFHPAMRDDLPVAVTATLDVVAGLRSQAALPVYAP